MTAMPRLSHICAALLASTAMTCGAMTGGAFADQITIVDQLDRTITLDGPADTVVMLPKPGAALLVAVDRGTAKLIGLHPAAKAALTDGILVHYMPELADISSGVVDTGFIPNVEEMLNLAPDVVFQWSMRPDEYIAPLEQVGLKVVAWDWGTKEILDAQIPLTGSVLGQDARAGQIVGWQDEVLAELDAAIGDVAEDERLRVSMIDTVEGGAIELFGRQEFFMTAGGLRNTTMLAGIDENNTMINAETLIAWDPDIIVLNYFNTTLAPSDILENPVFAGLTAVQTNRVYKMPRLDPFYQDSPLVWMWLATLAYPDRVDIDLRQRIRDAFVMLYGIDITEDDIDILLHMDMNAEIPGYADRFAAS